MCYLSEKSLQIIYLKKTADHVWKLFRDLDRVHPFLPFRDASPAESIYDLLLPHIFHAVERAHELRWIDFERFDVDAYEFFEVIYYVKCFFSVV